MLNAFELQKIVLDATAEYYEECERLCKQPDRATAISDIAYKAAHDAAEQAERQLAARGAATVAWVLELVQRARANMSCRTVTVEAGNADSMRVVNIAFRKADEEFALLEDAIRTRLLTQPEGAAVGGGDAVPIAEIEREIAHIEGNGWRVKQLPGMTDEGRCRELCAMYLREFITSWRMKQKLDGLPPSIGQEGATPDEITETVAQLRRLAIEYDKELAEHTCGWFAADIIEQQQRELTALRAKHEPKFGNDSRENYALATPRTGGSE